MADEQEPLPPEPDVAGPVSQQALRDTRLTPSEAVEHMRIRLPDRGNRKLRRVLERANADRELKGWWHVANVNAVVRLEINDHSWVHVQIVANIALKLLRQLTKHGVEPSLVRDYGMEREDAELVVVLAALTHCVGMHGFETVSTLDGVQVDTTTVPCRFVSRPLDNQPIPVIPGWVYAVRYVIPAGSLAPGTHTLSTTGTYTVDVSYSLGCDDPSGRCTHQAGDTFTVTNSLIITS